MATQLETNLKTILTEKNAKIVPENIKKGITIFNVEGTLEEGSGTEINNQDKTFTQNGIFTADEGYTGLGSVTVNVQGDGLKQYSSIEAMNADTTAEEGDIAIVYEHTQTENPVIGTEFQTMKFKSTVTLDTAITEKTFYKGISNVTTGSNDFRYTKQYCYISSTEMRMYIGNYNGNLNVRYTSSDGLTYKISSFSANKIIYDTDNYIATFSSILKLNEDWNVIIGSFFTTEYSTFNGLYKCSNTIDPNHINMHSITRSSASILCDFNDQTVIDITGLAKKLTDVVTENGYKISSCLLTTKGDGIFKAFAMANGATSTVLYDVEHVITEDLTGIFICCHPQSISTQSTYKKFLIEIDLNSDTSSMRELTQLGTFEYNDMPYYEGYDEDSYFAWVNISDNNITTNWTGIYKYYDGGWYYSSSGLDLIYILTYNSLPNQFSSLDASSIKQGLIAYGYNGPTEGDGTIYDSTPRSKAIEYLYYGDTIGEGTKYANILNQAAANDFVSVPGTVKMRFVKTIEGIDGNQLMVLFDEKEPNLDGKFEFYSYDYDNRVLVSPDDGKITVINLTDSTEFSLDIDTSEQILSTTEKVYNDLGFVTTYSAIENESVYNVTYNIYKIDFTNKVITKVSTETFTSEYNSVYALSFIDLTTNTYIVATSVATNKEEHIAYGMGYTLNFKLYSISMTEFTTLNTKITSEFVAERTSFYSAITNQRHILIGYSYYDWDGGIWYHNWKSYSLDTYELANEITANGLSYVASHVQPKGNAFVYEDDTYIYLYPNRAWNKTTNARETITITAGTLPMIANYDFTELISSKMAVYDTPSLEPVMTGMTIGNMAPCENTEAPVISISSGYSFIREDDGKYYVDPPSGKPKQIVPIEDVTVVDDWDYCLIPTYGGTSFGALYYRLPNPNKINYTELGTISPEEYTTATNTASEILTEEVTE